MRAKITAPEGFKAAPEGHTVVTYAYGEIVTGDVARWAVSAHAASAMFDPVDERKISPPPQTKRGRK